MRCGLVGLLAAGFVLGAVAHAAPGRYAIIIGNNVARGEPIDLNHADDDAQAFMRTLLDVGRFDRERIRLLIDAQPADLHRAARDLQRTVQRDVRQAGAGESVFLLYFTGHGSAQGLLTQGAPITGSDLLRVFGAIGADHPIGIFDACHAGKLASFTPGALDPKGVRPGPNPFVRLPRELDALEGVLLAGAQDIAYEAPSKGGLFTYFLIESLYDQRQSVVSLGAAFEYAQLKTQRFVHATNRVQRPASRNLDLNARALPLGFPHTTEVVFGSSVRGTFLFDYPDRRLKERVRAQGSAEVATGMVDLFHVTSDSTRALGKIVLEPEGRLFIGGPDDRVPDRLDYLAVGAPMAAKSATGLNIISERRIAEWALGVGYVWLPVGASPAALHLTELLLHGRHGRWVFGTFLRGGRRRPSLDWALTVLEAGAGAEAGLGWLGAGGTSVDGIVRLGGGVEHRDFEAASSSAPWFELTPAIRVRQRLGAFGLALTSGWLIRNGRAGLERGAARQWWGGPLLAAHLDWKM